MHKKNQQYCYVVSLFCYLHLSLVQDEALHFNTLYFHLPMYGLSQMWLKLTLHYFFKKSSSHLSDIDWKTKYIVMMTKGGPTKIVILWTPGLGFLSVWLKSNVYFRYRIEDLITPHYWSCSALIILANQIVTFMRVKVFWKFWPFVLSRLHAQGYAKT